MRGAFRLWGTVAALVVLHFLLHLGFGLGREAPDLLTLAVLVGARTLRMGSGAGLGFALGLLEDSFSLLAFGGNAIALTVIGALGARTRDFFVGDSTLFALLYLFVGKWVHEGVLWVVVGSALRDSLTDALLVRASLSALYVAVCGLLVLWVTGTWWESQR